MKIQDVLNSSRQILFENNVEGFEYSARGTGFVCRYEGTLFFVTAQHVIKDFNADALRIQYFPESRDFLPHNARANLVPRDKHDPDYADLAIFPIEDSMVDIQKFGEYPPYVLKNGFVRGDVPSGGTLIFRGFPHDDSSDRPLVDYDKFVIRQQPVILEAEKIGKSLMQGCFEFEINDLSPCTTLDGFSGSPVFWIGPKKEQRDHLFAGIIIKATYASKRGHYIGGEVLLKAFQKLREMP